MMDASECPGDGECAAVDVALAVALEAAEDSTVREYVRRAQHARVAEKDGGRDA